MSTQSINPFNGQLIKEYKDHDDAYIAQSIDKGHSRFLEWRTGTFGYRAALMQKCAEILENDKTHLGELISQEMGKVIKESLAELNKCAATCRYYAENAAQFLADEKLNASNGEAYIHYNPLGLILAIMPWNFPFWQVFRFAAPALMAGNTVLLKHASNVPQCALAIENIFTKAGFPEGCFTSLLIKTDKVKGILEHPKVVAATLTGSEKAGSEVASFAGKNLKKTVLELGGSDPFIVLKDADIDKAAKNAVTSRMVSFGQSCIAAKRFIIEATVYSSFADRFIANLKSLKRGDPMDMEVNYSVLARKDLAEELFEQVKLSIEKGASVLYGELPDRIESAFFPPMVLENLTPEMPAFNEELFGPVACFYKAGDENEAIAMANNSPFGLGGSVWTTDIEKGKRVASRVESGAVYINKMMASDPTVPFGGIKKSGYGRELSHLGIREFVNQKTVWIGE